jgi:hypothetical protein
VELPLPKLPLPKLPLEGWLPGLELDPESEPPKLDFESEADPKSPAFVEVIPPPNRFTLAFNCSIRGS